MDDHISDQEDPYAVLAGAIRRTVRHNDRAVTETTGSYKKDTAAFCYMEGGIAKYALTRTVRGLSFHSVVMHSDDDVFRFALQRLTGVRMQKGCFGIRVPEAFHLGAFADFIRYSASRDFRSLVKHYAKLARRKNSAISQENAHGLTRYSL